MKKKFIFVLLFCMSSAAIGQITLQVLKSDGITFFDPNDDVMVGEKLCLVINSDSNDYWNGGVFVSGEDRLSGTLTGRGLDLNDPNSRDFKDSHLVNAGENARVTAWQDSAIWGFDLTTFYRADGNSNNNTTFSGDWFVIDYKPDDVGVCNVGLYDYDTSWSDPNYLITISHSPSRDLNTDEIVDFFDYAAILSQWDFINCNDSNWCDGADLDRDTDVDYNDLGLFTEYWLWQPYSQMEAMAQAGGSGLEPGLQGENSAEFKEYAYVLTVGQSLSNYFAEVNEYDYSTINDAIAAMIQNNPNETNRGCIQVYPGIYIEQLNNFYPGGHNLPAYCDLIGMGENPAEVVIQHQRRPQSDPDFTDIASEIYADGLLCDGDNLVSNLKVHNVGQNQNSVKFRGEGTLENCIVTSKHNAVTGYRHLIVSGCDIEGKYLACIQVYSTFEISDCNIFPKTRSWGGEHPAGIKAFRSGTIDNVTIAADIASSDYEPHYDTPWLAGIILQLRNSQDTVRITNTNIDLNLTTIYHDNRPQETANWELFGVVSGGRNPNPTTSYPGKVIVDNCQIDLTGIEDISNPAGDGHAIMVAGICIQGGGSVDVIGNTSITTSRSTASYVLQGYEYSLNNQNGVLMVDTHNTNYDKKLTNGIITGLK